MILMQLYMSCFTDSNDSQFLFEPIQRRGALKREGGVGAEGEEAVVWE